MNKIKVLITGPSLHDHGGVANYYNVVLPKLSECGIDARYVEIGSTHGGSGKLHLLRDPWTVWRTIGQVAPDIVHINPSLDMRSFLRDGLFLLLAKLRGKPVLVFFRGWQVPFERRVEGGLNWYFALTYRHANGCIVLARRFTGKLREWGVRTPLYEDTTAVGDDNLKGFSPEPRVTEYLRPGTIRLLYLARLERDKGVLELLEAVLTLIDKGLDVSLTIAGEGQVLGELRERISRFGVAGQRIRLAGYVRGSDKIEVLQSHHIFCFPTQYGEGMPNAVLEAMGFGLPVITSSVGGLEDFFVDGKMGVLLKGNSPGEIAEAIERLLADRDSLVAMSRFNHGYALDRFLASKVAGRLRGYYAEILGLSGEERTGNNKH